MHWSDQPIRSLITLLPLAMLSALAAHHPCIGSFKQAVGTGIFYMFILLAGVSFSHKSK
jgi:hypothetical protein